MRLIILLATLTFYVIQVSHAHPKAKRSILDSALELSNESLKQRDDIKNYTINEMISLTKNTVQACKTLMENVDKYAENSELLNTTGLKFHLDSLKSLLIEINEFNELDSDSEVILREILGLYFELTEFFENYNDNPEDEEEKLINRLLRENGIENIFNKHTEELSKLKKDLEEKCDDYVKTLSEEDKVKDKEFLEWLKDLKNTDNSEEKNLLINKLLNIIEDEIDEDEEYENEDFSESAEVSENKKPILEQGDDASSNRNNEGAKNDGIENENDKASESAQVIENEKPVPEQGDDKSSNTNDEVSDHKTQE